MLCSWSVHPAESCWAWHCARCLEYERQDPASALLAPGRDESRAVEPQWESTLSGGKPEGKPQGRGAASSAREAVHPRLRRALSEPARRWLEAFSCFLTFTPPGVLLGKCVCQSYKCAQDPIKFEGARGRPRIWRPGPSMPQLRAPSSALSSLSLSIFISWMGVRRSPWWVEMR